MMIFSILFSIHENHGKSLPYNNHVVLNNPADFMPYNNHAVLSNPAVLKL